MDPHQPVSLERPDINRSTHLQSNRNARNNIPLPRRIEDSLRRPLRWIEFRDAEALNAWHHRYRRDNRRERPSRPLRGSDLYPSSVMLSGMKSSFTTPASAPFFRSYLCTERFVQAL